jgi:hypothetical protein
MTKILLIAALLTVGVGVRLKPMVADGSHSARPAASAVSLARRASRDRTRRSYLFGSVVRPHSPSNGSHVLI